MTGLTHPEGSLPEYCCQLLGEHVQDLHKTLPKLFQEAPGETIHDLRVTMRRMQSLWDVLVTLIPAVAHHPPRLWWHWSSRLGVIRDLEVEIELLQDGISPCPDGDSDGDSDGGPDIGSDVGSDLEIVIQHLRQLRQKRLHALCRHLTPSWWRKGLKQWQVWLNMVALESPLPLDPPTLIPDLIAPALSRWLLHPGWSVTDPHHPLLHALRKQSKRLRYQAELFRPWYGIDWQNWLSELQAIQETLGKIHDWQVLSARIQKTQTQKKTTALSIPPADPIAQPEQDWFQWQKRCTSIPYRQALHALILSTNLTLPNPGLSVAAD